MSPGIELAVGIITQMGVPGALLVWLYFEHKGRMQEREERIALQVRHDNLHAEVRTFMTATLRETVEALDDVKEVFRR